MNCQFHAMLTSSISRRAFYSRKIHKYTCISVSICDGNSVFVKVFRRLWSGLVVLCGAILDVIFSDTKFLNLSFLKEHKQLVMFMCVIVP